MECIKFRVSFLFDWRPDICCPLQVFGMLEKSGKSERRGLTLHGHAVCGKTFRLCLGIGRHRFDRLREAANKKLPCPVDERFMPKKFQSLPKDSVQPVVTEWLHEMYMTTAEPLPEAADNIRRRGKRPRSLYKTQPQEGQGHSSLAKFLPPGSIQDYLELCRSDHQGLKIGRKAFTRVPKPIGKGCKFIFSLKFYLLSKLDLIFEFGENAPRTLQAWEEGFRDKLFIRPRSQHAKCSYCVRHRLLLRRLRRQLPARAAQMIMYKRHLAKQYSDRLTYWKNRSHARLGENVPDGLPSLCVMIDSIDHSKFAWPKGEALNAKCFGQFVRPTLQVTFALVHGRALLGYISEAHVSHDSSWSADVLCNVLDVIKQECPELDLRRTVLHLHSDNASKELKNNTCLRLMSTLVGGRRLAACSLNTLQSGHSHEDIDQIFSGLASHIMAEQELSGPQAILESIERWMAQPSLRPLERVKRVVKVDQNRAWWPGRFVFIKQHRL